MMKRVVAVDDGGANATTIAYCCNNSMTRISDNDSDGERSAIVIERNEHLRIPSRDPYLLISGCGMAG